jgi:hypothetical protein
MLHQKQGWRKQSEEGEDLTLTMMTSKLGWTA